jgi:SAM-dependent methyltransferase
VRRLDELIQRLRGFGPAEPRTRIAGLSPSEQRFDAVAVKTWYSGSTVQPTTYERPMEHVQVLTRILASMDPESVLEFGCNAGRNLNLLRDLLPKASLVGVDLNALGIADGQQLYGLDLRVGDEDTVSRFATDEFDVTFTLSVLDHFPDITAVSTELTRITRRYLVLLEIAGDESGKATKMVGADGKQIAGYPFTYFHDYRQRIERELGHPCVLDAYFPVGTSNLLEFYRLYVFACSDSRWDGKLHLNRIEFG